MAIFIRHLKTFCHFVCTNAITYLQVLPGTCKTECIFSHYLASLTGGLITGFVRCWRPVISRLSAWLTRIETIRTRPESNEQQEYEWIETGELDLKWVVSTSDRLEGFLQVLCHRFLVQYAKPLANKLSRKRKFHCALFALRLECHEWSAGAHFAPWATWLLSQRILHTGWPLRQWQQRAWSFPSIDTRQDRPFIRLCLRYDNNGIQTKPTSSDSLRFILIGQCFPIKGARMSWRYKTSFQRVREASALKTGNW